jgi:hypothetical protein
MAPGIVWMKLDHPLKQLDGTTELASHFQNGRHTIFVRI